MKILRLTLKRKYFAEIVEGKKKTEYRKRKPYWKKRLEGKDFDLIEFKNGYLRNAPRMRVEFRGIRREGSEYAIRLGRIRKITRWHSGIN